MDQVDAIDGRDRETLFDEVIYLRFLTGRSVKADDFRLIARKYAAGSLIAGRLIDEFEVFISFLEKELKSDQPTLSNLSRFGPNYGQGMNPVPPPASNWPEYRKFATQFTNSSLPKGRIFSVNIDVGFSNVGNLLAVHLARAEDAFRRDRGIPEVGSSKWTSELALLDLFKSIWPSAEHQWRPMFLGRQSVDIYIPEINLAIEYQGKQHYEPISLFGGDEGFKNAQTRDARKRRLLDANRVRLLEWRYDTEITHEELVRKLSDIGVELPVKN